MQRQMRHTLYLPPGYTPSKPLPLVVFLHGSGDGPDALDRFGVTEALERGLAPEAIIVSPQGDVGFWENWHDGERPYRDWVLDELLVDVQARYSTLPCPESCHVMGISMGGHGALSFLIHRPGYFATASAISPPLFDAQSVKEFYDSFWWGLLLPIEKIWGPYDPARVRRRDPFVQLRGPADTEGARVLVAWGLEEEPGMREGAEALAAHLSRGGISNRAMPFEGGHQWTDWKPVVLEALRWQQSRGAATRYVQAPAGGLLPSGLPSGNLERGVR